MTRSTLDASTLAALEDNSAKPTYFVELQFDGGTERFSTHVRTVSWGGFSWVGAGQLAAIEGIEEGLEITPYAARMGLSGVDSTVSNFALNENWYRRRCIIYLGALDAADDLVSDPGIVFSGYIDGIDMAIADPESGDSVLLTAESELVDFERQRNVRFTENQLQSEYPGDLGFEWLEQVKHARVVWRGEGQAITGRSTGSGVPSIGGRDLGGFRGFNF